MTKILQIEILKEILENLKSHQSKSPSFTKSEALVSNLKNVIQSLLDIENSTKNSKENSKENLQHNLENYLSLIRNNQAMIDKNADIIQTLSEKLDSQNPETKTNDIQIIPIMSENQKREVDRFYTLSEKINS